MKHFAALFIAAVNTGTGYYVLPKEAYAIIKDYVQTDRFTIISYNAHGSGEGFVLMVSNRKKLSDTYEEMVRHPLTKVGALCKYAKDKGNPDLGGKDILKSYTSARNRVDGRSDVRFNTHYSSAYSVVTTGKRDWSGDFQSTNVYLTSAYKHDIPKITAKCIDHVARKLNSIPGSSMWLSDNMHNTFSRKKLNYFVTGSLLSLLLDKNRKGKFSMKASDGTTVYFRVCPAACWNYAENDHATFVAIVSKYPIREKFL